MMNKNGFILILFMLLPIFTNCTTPKKDISVAAPWVNQNNEKLKEISILEFDYKSAQMPTRWDNWKQDNLALLKNVIEQMTGEYRLYVIGHTDASGPEVAKGNKPGNIIISADRAKTIYEALKKMGLNSGKLAFKGVGSSEPLVKYNPRDKRQRRVSFRIMPVE